MANLLPERATYVGAGVGRGWNRALMEQCARRSGGVCGELDRAEDLLRLVRVYQQQLRVIGEGGVLPSNKVKAGFSLQGPDTYYPPHAHHAEESYWIIGGNGDSIFKRLTVAMGQPEMGDDPRFADNAGRVEHEPEIDAAIEAWMATLTKNEALQILEKAEVPSGPIYSVADMVEDEPYNARGMFESVEINGEPLKIPARSATLIASTPVFGSVIGISLPVSSPKPTANMRMPRSAASFAASSGNES